MDSCMEPLLDLKRDYQTALRLIRDLTDRDDCWFDHHGGCLGHGELSLKPGQKCPHQKAKELLAANNIEI